MAMLRLRWRAWRLYRRLPAGQLKAQVGSWRAQLRYEPAGGTRVTTIRMRMALIEESLNE